ncbi:hypothetical protein LJY25_12915 [Hymenobacter sp. BT175]|uniref:hypothetical protein n=1 Tax=Hymenobacter translucens TaxID=2886507 RepID=UPI001D0F0306|nr:hypothetical protein [Hymenobacter translucens]MCC2547349.1 hypothetical protein [Hymenobacter translucens]
MKKLFLFCALLTGSGLAAQAQTTVDKQALAKELNGLMSNPATPTKKATVVLTDCQVDQIFRDSDADVTTSKPVSVTFNRGESATGWAVKAADGAFELRMSFEWRDVKSITYHRKEQDDDKAEKTAPYEIQIRRARKGNTTTSDFALYTTDEARVKDLVRRLELVRQSCGR